MWIKQTSDGTISFGKSGSSTAIYSLDANGVSQGGTNLISRTSDGITSIGANSVKLQEISDIQRIWATNSSGTKIPINIYGSDFQINGVSVQDQIDTNKSGISTNSSNIKNFIFTFSLFNSFIISLCLGLLRIHTVISEFFFFVISE